MVEGQGYTLPLDYSIYGTSCDILMEHTSETLEELAYSQIAFAGRSGVLRNSSRTSI